MITSKTPKIDTLTKAMLFSGAVSITAVQSTRLVNRAVKLHRLSPVCAAALGRTLTVTAILGSELKNPADKLSVSVKGGGEAGTVTVSCDEKLRVRGTIGRTDLDYPLNELGKLDVGRAVGHSGTLTVIKDLGLKEPYVGQCSLVSGEIGEDFARYFLESEQQPSAVALGVLADKPKITGKMRQTLPVEELPFCRCASAGGFVIRILPFCPEEIIVKAEAKLASLPQVSSAMRGKSAEEFLKEHFSDCELEITETLYPKYRCKCSRRSMESLLHTLKYEDLKAYAEEDGQVDVHCHYCNKHYSFTAEDIRRIFHKE